MADKGDTFLREVDEELRREQIQKLWDAYGVYAIGLAVALLVGVGGWQWWQGRRTAAIEAAGAQFERAVQLAAENKPEEAAKAFGALAQSSSRGYRALALLRAAAVDAQAGRRDAAVASYEAVARENVTDQVLRDFATLQAANLRLDQADFKEMDSRLGPLVNSASPWHALARETLALSAYKAGRLDEARKLYEQILGDRATPQSVSERTLLMLAVITDAEAAKAAPAPAPAQPAAAPSPAPAGKEEPKKADAKGAPAKK